MQLLLLFFFRNIIVSPNYRSKSISLLSFKMAIYAYISNMINFWPPFDLDVKSEKKYAKWLKMPLKDIFYFKK